MANSDDVISGFEKIVGLIYRIIFTLIPSGTLILITTLFMNNYFPGELKYLLTFFHSLTGFQQGLLLICLIFSISMLLEAINVSLFYYAFDFNKLSDDRLFNRTPKDDLRKEEGSFLQSIYKHGASQHLFANKFIFNSRFSLGLIGSLMKSPRVFNHIYYQLGKEFVFNNLTIVLLISANLFVPCILLGISNSKQIEIPFEHLFYLQPIQLFLSFAILIICFVQLKNYIEHRVSENTKTDESKCNRLVLGETTKRKIWLVVVPALSLIISVILFSLGVNRRSIWLLILGFNLFLFPILNTMIFNGFREFLYVEKYCMAYLIETYFSNEQKGKKELKWVFYRPENLPEKAFELEKVPQILHIFRNGMGIQGWHAEGVKITKNTSSFTALLEDDEKQFYGYFFITVPDDLLHAKKILWIEACCLLKTSQKSGYYKKAIEQAIALYGNDNIGWLGGRTQNPAIILAHDKLSNGAFYPFDKLYPFDISNYLVTSIREAEEPNSHGKYKPETGICTAVYKEGKLGDYEENLTQGRCPYFEEKLKEWGFSRKDGDAVVILKKIN